MRVTVFQQRKVKIQGVKTLVSLVCILFSGYLDFRSLSMKVGVRPQSR